MDQCPPGPSVSVGKWVDCLELGVGDGGLHEWRVFVAVHVLDEVLDKAIDVVRWWWDEHRAARVVGTAAYPVLPFANDPSEFGPP